MKANKLTHIIGSISRTLLAITFLFSGFVKAVDTTSKLSVDGATTCCRMPVSQPCASSHWSSCSVCVC